MHKDINNSKKGLAFLLFIGSIAIIMMTPHQESTQSHLIQGNLLGDGTGLTATNQIYTKQEDASQIPVNRVTATVTRVVDGDTIEVNTNGETSKVRLIGINTPESVDPRRKVECLGKEASAKTGELLAGKTVLLESDPSQSDRDKYNRLLRYVFLEDGTNINKTLIQKGYAYEYTYNIPYRYQKQFKQAQTEAEKAKIGLWADGACE